MFWLSILQYMCQHEPSILNIFCFCNNSLTIILIQLFVLNQRTIFMVQSFKLVCISPVFLCNTYFDFYDNLIYIFIYVKSSFFLLPFFSRKSLYKTLIQRQNWESLRLFWTWLQILDNSDDVLICREPVNFTKFFFLSVECDILEMILFLIEAHFWVIMGNLIYGINFS